MGFLVAVGFIALDLITGVILAVKKRAWNSSIMREGLFHKMGSLLCLVLGFLTDYAQSYIDLGVNVPVAVAICTYISIMELGSIIENVAGINPEIVPEKMAQYFAKIKNKE